MFRSGLSPSLLQGRLSLGVYFSRALGETVQAVQSPPDALAGWCDQQSQLEACATSLRIVTGALLIAPNVFFPFFPIRPTLCVPAPPPP